MGPVLEYPPKLSPTRLYFDHRFSLFLEPEHSLQKFIFDSAAVIWSFMQIYSILIQNCVVFSGATLNSSAFAVRSPSVFMQ